MLRAWTYVQSRILSDKGASLVEYALLLVLIALAAIIAIRALGTSVSDTFDDAQNQLDGVTPTT